MKKNIFSITVSVVTVLALATVGCSKKTRSNAVKGRVTQPDQTGTAANLSALEAELEKVKKSNEIKNLKATIARLNETINSLKGEVTSAVGKANDFAENNVKQMTALNTRLEKTEGLVANVSDGFDDSQNEEQILEEVEQDEVQETLGESEQPAPAEKETTPEVVVDEVPSAEQDAEKMRAELEAAKTDVEVLTEKVDRLNKENASAQEKVDEFNKELEDKKDELAEDEQLIKVACKDTVNTNNQKITVDRLVKVKTKQGNVVTVKCKTKVKETSANESVEKEIERKTASEENNGVPIEDRSLPTKDTVPVVDSEEDEVVEEIEEETEDRVISEESIEEQKEEIKAGEVVRGDLQKEIDKKNAEIKELNDQLAEAIANAKELEEKVIDLEAKLKIAKKLPGYIFTRLAKGDLVDTPYPFLLSVYGNASEKEIAAVRDVISSELNLISDNGVRKSSVSKLKFFGSRPIMDRYLIQNTYQEVEAIANRIGSEELPGNIMVSVKPVENVEIDTYISWTPKNTKLKEKKKLWTLVRTNNHYEVGTDFDAELLNDPTFDLENCEFVNPECLQSMVDEGLLPLTDQINENSTAQERSSYILTNALKMSSVLDNLITKRGESLPGHVVASVKEAFASSLNWVKFWDKNKIIVPSDYAIRNMEIESRIWIVQKQYLNRDPSPEDLMVKDRETLLLGMEPDETTYITQDNTNRYYLLPLTPSKGYPEKWINDDLNKNYMDELKRNNTESLEVLDPDFDLEEEVRRMEEAAKEKEEEAKEEDVVDADTEEAA